MTTIGERREWMRAGCPVEEATAVAVSDAVEQAVAPEPEVEVSMPCRSFHLGVIPSRGEWGVLAARCNDCDAVMEHGEILLVDTDSEEKVAQGDWDAMRGLCIEMNGHGKGPWGEVGSMLIGKPGHNHWQSIEAWIQELMLHGGRYGSMPVPRMKPDDFEQSGWKFSFNDFPLSMMSTRAELKEIWRELSVYGPFGRPYKSERDRETEAILREGDAMTTGERGPQGVKDALSWTAARLRGEPVPEPKRPGLLAGMLNRLGLGGGP